MSESGVKISDLVAQLKSEANQDQEVQFLVVNAQTSEVIQMDLRENIVDVQKLLMSFKKPSKKPSAKKPKKADPANACWNALLNYVLDGRIDEPMELLRMWREGAFDEIRQEWPDVPDAIFPKP